MNTKNVYINCEITPKSPVLMKFNGIFYFETAKYLNSSGKFIKGRFNLNCY